MNHFLEEKSREKCKQIRSPGFSFFIVILTKQLILITDLSTSEAKYMGGKNGQLGLVIWSLRVILD